VTLSIVDPASQAVLANWTYAVDILQGKSYQSAQTWSSGAGKANTGYMAVLTASDGGKTLTLGYDTFTVAAPKFGVTNSGSGLTFDIQILSF
jgi:hypothetical protein